MDQNNGTEAETSKQEIRFKIMMDLQEVLPHLIRVSLTDKTSLMDTTIRKTEKHVINAQNSHSIEAMEIDLEMDLSTTRMGTRKTVEIFAVLHRLKGDIFHKINHTADQEVKNLSILPSAELTINL